MEKILHIGDISKILGVDADTVIGFIQSGEIKSAKVGNKYHIRESDLELFLKRKIESQQLERFSKELSNPKLWAEQLQQDPHLFGYIKNTKFPDGTMGSFLKKALEAP